jgi:hypothetical protein
MKRYGKDGDSVRYATATNIVKKKLGIEDMEEAFTKKDFKDNERDNEHGLNATKVVGMFGTAKEKMKIDAINARHNMRGSISRADQTERDAIVNKYYGKLKEQRALTNPDVATALRQYAAQRPLEFKKSAGNFPYKEGDKKANFDILQDLALKDMKQFNIKFKAMDNDSKDHVKKALAKKGLSSTLVNDNKPKGDQTMNESYKDKFNATMKKFGIDSLDDLKSDEEKKKFFRAVDNAHDAKNEETISEKKNVYLQVGGSAGNNISPNDISAVKKELKTSGIRFGEVHDGGSYATDVITIRNTNGSEAQIIAAVKKISDFRNAKISAKSRNEELEEELTPAQKKLPAGLQKAIAAKGDKKDEMMTKEMMDEMMKEMMKEMSSKMEMLKAEKDPTKVEMMKKEMSEMMKKEMAKMSEMDDMPEMSEMMKKEMMKEMMKKMDEYGSMNAMKEGFSSDAQRKAAFASGYKEKGKKKDEMKEGEVNEILPAIARVATGAALTKQASGDAKSTVKNVKTMNAKHKPGHNEMAMNAMKMNAMKMPIRAMYKMNAMKTGDDDLTPMNNMKMNAMIKDPHKSKEEDPKRDMNAGYMKSDVRADVKNGGGIDMSKVKDAPKMQTAMKKINAMYKTERYHDTKPGSIQDVVNQMYHAEHRLVTVEDKKLDDMIKQYMSKGGTITKLPPALQKGSKPSDMKKHQVGAKGVVKSMKMKEVREFISTYNSHFLTNFKAEEFILKD